MDTTCRYLKSKNQNDVLGYGSYGLVTKSLDLLTNETVAIKEVVAERGISCSTLREIVILGQIQRTNHPNLIKIKNVVTNQGNEAFSREIVLDCADTDLNKYLKGLKVDIDIEQIRNFTAQILQGLSYCHSINIVHRDVKPSNILMKGGVLKLADFGLARAISPTKDVLSPDVVTRCYRSPELLLGETRYSFSVDIWSVGCILAELVTRIPLFRGTSDVDQLIKIFRILGTPTSESWPGYHLLKGMSNLPDYEAKNLKLTVFNRLDVSGLELLLSLLSCDPTQRPTTDSSLQHLFLKSQLQNVQNLHKLHTEVPMVQYSNDKKRSDEFQSIALQSQHQKQKPIEKIAGQKRVNSSACFDSMNLKDTLQLIQKSVFSRATNVVNQNITKSQSSSLLSPAVAVAVALEPTKTVVESSLQSTPLQSAFIPPIDTTKPCDVHSKSTHLYRSTSSYTLPNSCNMNLLQSPPIVCESAGANDDEEDEDDCTRVVSVTHESVLIPEEDEDDVEIINTLSSLHGHEGFTGLATTGHNKLDNSSTCNNNNNNNRSNSGDSSSIAITDHHDISSSVHQNGVSSHDATGGHRLFQTVATDHHMSGLVKSMSQTSLYVSSPVCMSARTDRDDMSTFTLADSTSTLKHHDHDFCFNIDLRLALPSYHSTSFSSGRTSTELSQTDNNEISNIDTSIFTSEFTDLENENGPIFIDCPSVSAPISKPAAVKMRGLQTPTTNFFMNSCPQHEHKKRRVIDATAE